MKILLVTHLYYPSIGGNQILNQELAEKLVGMGEDVTVFTANALSFTEFDEYNSSVVPLKDFEIINGVKVRRFKIHKKWNHFLFHQLDRIRGGHRLRQMIFGETFDMWAHGPYVPQMLPAIKKNQYDVILAINYYPATTYLAYLAKKKYKIPLVIMPLTHHCDKWRYNSILKQIYDLTDMLIVSTEFEKKYLIDFKVSPQKIQVMGHGIELSKLQGASGEEFKNKHGIKDGPVIVCVARKVKGKGMEQLIDAMRLVWQQKPEAQLVLAGKKYEAHDKVIQKHLSALTEDERSKVFNVNDFEDDERKNIYAAAFVFVLASVVESFGLSNIEAWACGLPIIACKKTPQETMVEQGKDGLLVEYGNIQELSDAIVHLINNPEVSKQMGQAGRQKVLNNFTMDIYGQRVKDLLHSFLK